MSADELLDLDATDQAAAIRNREVSSAELVQAAIERANACNPRLNSIIVPRYPLARTEAANHDATTSSRGPFAGVPMVQKDLSIMTAGEPYYAGTRALKEIDYRAPVDTYLATKFRDAGFVSIGRTNTPEFGSTITTEPLSFGPCRNPWNTDHSTGGSSGGSAAAVAAGIVAVGHANDGGGSIRIPAGECGLFGLKPTRARVSAGPVLGEAWMGATIEHVVTRSVRDSAAVLDAIHGAMPGDPYAAPTPKRPFLAEVGADPGNLRIGFDVGAGLPHPTNQECVDAVLATAKQLEALGHRVEPARPCFDDQEFQHHFVTILTVSLANEVAAIEELVGRPLTDADIEPENLFYAEIGKAVSGTGYLSSVGWMHDFQRRMAAWWTAEAGGGLGFDLLLTPTLAVPPPPIGWVNGTRVSEIMLYTPQFNITGQPGVSLPLHMSAGGLPIGVQLVAEFGREDLLLRISSQLEAAHPWVGRRPTVYGLQA